jgi:hypothetical protein
MTTSIIDATYNPTQSVVTFLKQTGETTLNQSQRIFDFDISSESQKIYSTLMNAILDAPASSQGTPTDYLKTVSAILSVLDSWSQLKKVVDGQTVPNQSVAITIEDPALRSILATAFPGQTYSSTDQVIAVRDEPIYNSTEHTLTINSTMNRYMAESLDTIIRTLRAAGWDPIYSPLATNPLKIPNARDALFTLNSSTGNYVPETTYGIYDLIQRAIDIAATASISTDATTQSQSLQQLLMVDYVVRGNDLLYTEMSSLNTAITLNQQTLSFLNALQDLMNQKDPQHFLLQLQTLSNLTETSYSAFEQQTFGSQTLGTVAKFTDDQLQSYVLTAQMKAAGIDPTSPLGKALYGTGNNYENLVAIMDYNITNGLINTDGTLKTGAIDPTTAAAQAKYHLTPADGYTYINAIGPMIQSFYLRQGGHS